jgi:glycine cleavage system transcriptional repressor
MKSKKNYYALAFICEDQPGIVMKVSRILLDNNFNIEDSSSTLLEGIFSMILIVSLEESMSTLQIKKAFAPLVKSLKLSLSVRKLSGVKHEKTDNSNRRYIITVYGSDKPGIVYNIAKVLAYKNINIVDLQTKVIGDEANPVYMMILEILLPISIDSNWEKDLSDISEQLNIDINIKHVDSYEM